VRSGKLLSGPTAAGVPTYAVQVKDDTVYVQRHRRWDPHGRIREERFLHQRGV